MNPTNTGDQAMTNQPNQKKRWSQPVLSMIDLNSAKQGGPVNPDGAGTKS
jgi:hypothetical protein